MRHAVSSLYRISCYLTVICLLVSSFRYDVYRGFLWEGLRFLGRRTPLLWLGHVLRRRDRRQYPVQ
ncbi:hypothetical protein BX666DRAFT_1963387 [Dichotomocladium elegans]|nr:hypothetical protein BX666DRAFT_1963387 [Dichotomocladium elegans]